jgi:asparagine synthetase B (glutamine-hydrolysing)
MLICFVYSAGSQPLQVYRDEADGYYYPHVAERVSDTSHRFFAGRLTGVPASKSLPADHPVSSNNAADWSFPSGEPDGSWIALKYDRERDALSIAADVFNVQRWYYHRRGEQWYLANSLRYLFRTVPGLEIEWRAAPYMLHYGYLPRRLTPLKDVAQLDAGEVLTISRGIGSVSRRVHLPVHRRPILESGNHAESVANAVYGAVSREISDLDHLMLPISGGMDSRFLLGCALSILPPEKITTLTFGWA